MAPLSVYANTKAWGEAQTALVLGKANVSHASDRGGFTSSSARSWGTG